MATCNQCLLDKAEVVNASGGSKIIVCRLCDPVADVMVISRTPECASAALLFAKQLRKKNIKTVAEVRDIKFKKKFEIANKMGAYYVVVFGEDELKANTCTLKDMDSGEQANKKIDFTLEFLHKMLTTDFKSIKLPKPKNSCPDLVELISYNT